MGATRIWLAEQWLAGDRRRLLAGGPRPGRRQGRRGRGGGRPGGWRICSLGSRRPRRSTWCALMFIHLPAPGAGARVRRGGAGRRPGRHAARRGPRSGQPGARRRRAPGPGGPVHAATICGRRCPRGSRWCARRRLPARRGTACRSMPCWWPAGTADRHAARTRRAARCGPRRRPPIARQRRPCPAAPVPCGLPASGGAGHARPRRFLGRAAPGRTPAGADGASPMSTWHLGGARATQNSLDRVVRGSELPLPGSGATSGRDFGPGEVRIDQSGSQGTGEAPGHRGDAGSWGTAEPRRPGVSAGRAGSPGAPRARSR